MLNTHYRIATCNSFVAADSVTNSEIGGGSTCLNLQANNGSISGSFNCSSASDSPAEWRSLHDCTTVFGLTESIFDTLHFTPVSSLLKLVHGIHHPVVFTTNYQHSHAWFQYSVAF